ncbi:hypothetical protein [Nitrospirillum viridazoti]|uniref:Uncharacterized protein n=2 Tax=Nitrospirillum TaxID=1543705 RepID=A0A248JQR2_9PROT|nr:hypothetical protein [Nitrospirillum amazonense]ASG21072.1 hypothetical protein Y958_09720 [Nitrospirillum amazonense CBAmc]TWB32425.1 hypothetical protein FBZ91_11726 [Nitrospirillum amazonense]
MTLDGVQVREDGLVVGFRYHDGQLAGFAASEDGLRFDIRSVDGAERTILKAGGVIDFAVQDYWPGTILSTIHLWRLGEPALPPLAAQALDDLYQGRATVGDLSTLVARQRRYHPEALILHLDSSYGGTFTCLCEWVRHVDGNTA